MGNNQDKKWIPQNKLLSPVHGKVELFEIAIKLNTNLGVITDLLLLHNAIPEFGGCRLLQSAFVVAPNPLNPGFVNEKAVWKVQVETKAFISKKKFIKQKLSTSLCHLA